jgi:hypothetical protein
MYFSVGVLLLSVWKLLLMMNVGLYTFIYAVDYGFYGSSEALCVGCDWN